MVGICPARGNPEPGAVELPGICRRAQYLFVVKWLQGKVINRRGVLFEQTPRSRGERGRRLCRAAALLSAQTITVAFFSACFVRRSGVQFGPVLPQGTPIIVSFGAVLWGRTEDRQNLMLQKKKTKAQGTIRRTGGCRGSLGESFFLRFRFWTQTTASGRIITDLGGFFRPRFVGAWKKKP